MLGRTVASRLSEVWDVLVGSDPGLLRLRLGLRAVVAIGLVVAVQNAVAPHVGIPTVVAILLGGMVAMNGSFSASSRPPRDAAMTLLFFPVAAGCGVFFGCLVAGHRVAGLVVFVVVMVAAVFVRRFGPRGFQYGMIGWLAYFFTMFVGFRLEQFGDVMAVIASSAFCVLVSAIIVVPDRPVAAYLQARRAFDVRVVALAEAAREALAGEIAPERVSRLLHAKSFRVVEAALIVDGHLSRLSSAGTLAAATRQGLLDVELAAEELASAAEQLAFLPDFPDRLRSELVGAFAEVRRSDLADARRQVAELARRTAAEVEELPIAVARHVRAVVRALQQLLEGLDVCVDQAPVPEHVREFKPAVQLFLGNLPSSAPSAVAALSDGQSWWSRRSLNTRLCIQVAVAGGIAVFVGDLLSGRRYYWAVLACFLALTGTFTTGEIAVKGMNRVIGTFAGLIAATVAVHLTGQDEAAIVAVVIICVFLGLYFFRISYAVMAFAITTVMGELYNVLHEFSDRLLLLRLAETALGAVAGIAVALVVLPVRTASVRASVIDAFLSELRGLLDDVRQRLATGAKTSDLFLTVRQLDSQLHQLALVALPAGGQTLIGLSSRRASRRLVPFTEAAYCARALAAATAQLSLALPESELRDAQWAGELASRADAVVRQLASLHASDGLTRVNAALSGVTDELRMLRRDVDRQLRRVTGGPEDTGEFLIRSMRAGGGPA